MTTRILLIAHAPLAHALRECALHVFADSADSLLVLDVLPHAAPDDTLRQAQQLLADAPDMATLVLTDLFAATPCNVAQRLVDGVHSRLVTGANLPMLLRAVSYRHESLDSVVNRAVVGGTQGVMQVAISAPQNQNRRKTHDQDPYDHQQ